MTVFNRISVGATTIEYKVPNGPQDGKAERERALASALAEAQKLEERRVANERIAELERTISVIGTERDLLAKELTTVTADRDRAIREQRHIQEGYALLRAGDLTDSLRIAKERDRAIGERDQAVNQVNELSEKYAELTRAFDEQALLLAHRPVGSAINTLRQLAEHHQTKVATILAAIHAITDD